jgi:molybdenum cofactor biosynthesis enzyme MoaA
LNTRPLRALAHDYTEMSFLRASVADVCNLNCVYCPKQSGMENYVPPRLRGQRLDVDQYCLLLERIARLGFQGICFTGGEPTSNPHLAAILRRVRPHFEVVEITTNGFRLGDVLAEVGSLVDRIKVSLDSPEREAVLRITGGRGDPHEQAMTALVSALNAGIDTTVNTVVMRNNVGSVPTLVEELADLAARLQRPLQHSLYDMYYTDERRSWWEHEFIPLSLVEAALTERFGPPLVDGLPDRRFLIYRVGLLSVIFKDSLGATPRAPKCAACSEFCQEGVCSLRLSVEGWVTACPSGSRHLGVYADPASSERALADLVRDLALDVHMARTTSGTLAKMIDRQGLHPMYPLRELTHRCAST